MSERPFDVFHRLQIEVSDEHHRMIEASRLARPERMAMVERVLPQILDLLADVSPYDSAPILVSAMATNFTRMPDEVARAFLRGMVAMLMDTLGYEPAKRESDLWLS